MTPLARLAMQSEQRQPGTLEAALRRAVPAPSADCQWSSFVYNFVGSQAAAGFFSSLAAMDTARDADADFSQEFGNDEGFAGGSGFEGDSFDKWT
jgi:hypothetical protein